MVTTQTQVEPQAIELSAEAFNAFCEDISGMFGVDMECNQQEISAETIDTLKKRFKKLVAVNSVKAEGTLNGTFQLVFGQEGLFTLAGVIVMLPEQRILDNRKRGSAKDAEDMNDAVSEAGNMLVGSWDRVFREGLDGHGHFAQTNTFIGNPWDEPEEKIGLAGDEEFVFVPYEMTINPYPAFKCGVLFPKTIFEPASQSDAEEENQEPEAAVEEADSQESKPQEPPAEEPAVEEAIAEEETKEAAKAENDNVDADVPDNAVNEKAAAAPETEQVKESATGKISETIQKMNQSPNGVSETIEKMTQSPAKLPGESDLPVTTEAPGGSISISLAVCAKDIMQEEVIWGAPDDSVQQALAKMQQYNVGYMMVGKDGVLEGIVSKSDITATASIYLKPVFAKWRRPLDDATLQIKIKWIMSKPVRTIGQDTSLSTIMENMCQFGLRALGVLDEQGKVAAIVTVFDVFKALLKCNPNIPAASQK